MTNDGKLVSKIVIDGPVAHLETHVALLNRVGKKSAPTDNKADALKLFDYLYNAALPHATYDELVKLMLAQDEKDRNVLRGKKR